MTDSQTWYEPFDNSLKTIKILIKSQLWAQIILALVLGISVGLLLSPQGGGWLVEDQATVVAEWVKLPGSVFLAMIQMVVIPLVMSSIRLLSARRWRFGLSRVGLSMVHWYKLLKQRLQW